jgi:hypothetical protein
MSTENIVFDSDTAQTITFATKKGDAITYVYGNSDWKAYRSGADPEELDGVRVATPAGAAQLAIQFAARAADAAAEASIEIGAATTMMGIS